MPQHFAQSPQKKGRKTQRHYTQTTRKAAKAIKNATAGSGATETRLLAA